MDGMTALVQACFWQNKTTQEEDKALSCVHEGSDSAWHRSTLQSLKIYCTFSIKRLSPTAGAHIPKPLIDPFTPQCLAGHILGFHSINANVMFVSGEQNWPRIIWRHCCLCRRRTAQIICGHLTPIWVCLHWFFTLSKWGDPYGAPNVDNLWRQYNTVKISEMPPTS